MKKIPGVFLLLFLGWGLFVKSAGAADFRWMQTGVRLWYFGGANTSNAEEAYLLGAVDGGNIQVTHHSAVDYWSLPNPAGVSWHPMNSQGPCWMHPQTLQNLQMGDLWQGLEVTLITRADYTYDSFLDALPKRNHFLPVKALFDLAPQRQLVRIMFMIPGTLTGTAYFDADTGLLLYYNKSTGFVATFFILSEINYNFAAGRAFAEDEGPHTGFRSYAMENSVTPISLVFIQSMVETRYGNTVELWVTTSLGGTISTINRDEHFCYFGDVPVLRRIDSEDAGASLPEQWNPFGEYLFWWVPPAALEETAVDVYDVSMGRTAVNPYTFSAATTPEHFHFTTLQFGDDGYMTEFFARDPTIGLELNVIFQNQNRVDGLDYYRNTMGTARPAEIRPQPGVNLLLLD
ncbi:MAG: hypothetical protein JW793_01935 [Acidobacteria bacterium]|nr:hypothetical protein [Acidobacteriota bacterium]